MISTRERGKTISTNPSITIELLGGLRIKAESQIITRFSTQKTGALLAYLAYFRERAHPRETVIDLLWPQAAPQAGRASLSVALSSLRHQMEPPDTPAGTVLRADRFAIQLNPDLVTTDVAAFERELDAAAKTKNLTEQAQHLLTAVGLYQGVLLPGYYEEWIPAEQERLAERYFQAIRRLIRHETKARDLHRALEYARQAVQMVPLREEAHQDLIRLYVAANQPAAALAQFRALETIFREELGAAPSAASQKLAKEIEGITLSVPSAAARPVPASPAPPDDSSPVGIVTFLFTDIEKSTALWERFGDAFKTTLAAHHTLLRREFRKYNGYEAKEAGDSFLVVFTRPKDALQCAIACQRLVAERLHLPETDGTPAPPLRVRMALHTGEAERDGDDYRGLPIHRASRLLSAAHGGQILCSETTASLLSGNLDADIRLLDLGIYRLRDLPQPERLFQAVYPDMGQRSFPPPAAEVGYANNLPLQFTRFFGREEELRRLSGLLAPPEADEAVPARRLITLLGPGGTGKTRLAIEAARQAAPAFSGAAWFVPLADVADASAIPAAIAEALRLPRLAGVEPLEQVVEALRNQPSLLVLDNFEQIVADGAAQAQNLLAQIPSLVCLVTSRQKLDIAGEQSFPLHPLPVLAADANDADCTARSLLGMESARMFVDRAQQARPDFQLTDGNAPAIAALCRALEGIPLAIELAAARAQVLTPTQMLAQISNRFDFLVSRRRDRAERHRTLRGTIEWSFRLLSPELQTFFVRLGVFRGGWTLEAAEAVCEEPLALDYLAELQECSLLIAEETEQDDSGEMRFRMLETLRDYAEAVAAPEERQAAQERHRDYFAKFAREAHDKLIGEQQAVWLERLEREHENLRTALRYCGDAPQTHLKIVANLWRFWEMRGHYREGRERYAAALARPDAQEPTMPRASTLNGAGNMAYHQGDLDEAREYYEAGLAIYRALESQNGMAITLGNLANIASDWGDYGRARELYGESLTIKRAIGGIPFSEAITLSNLGNVHLREGDYAGARKLYEEALNLHASFGNDGGRLIVLVSFGAIAFMEGDLNEARTRYLEALLLCRELGEQLRAAMALEGLARVACRTNRQRVALRLYSAASALRERMGTPIEPEDLEARDEDLTALRDALGEEAYAAEWNAGQSLSTEQAISYALDALAPAEEP